MLRVVALQFLTAVRPQRGTQKYTNRKQVVSKNRQQQTLTYGCNSLTAERFA